ncbi:MAG: methyltransferase domain-containing protein [Cytophagia bacterium]|nr:MAG: methyltransferase domain-containing protein [Runella sp.]TAG20221.1 MAG: methyltransferase domain-containing protein [Cytophagales bacterium]TAG39340.1 MAG: methyltransferase domain-containing protein [Cytophagia bacterium]TAG81034.1 MAG: methyltransferase domain-containing protein [Cytophagales bacterium]
MDRITRTLPINAEYWDNQYKQNTTGWDLKQVSPSLKAYFEQLDNKKLAILIAGCGNAYEAEYLYSLGFQNITLVDISETLVNTLKEKWKDTSIQIVLQDIFEHQGMYDLIVEQTLFCAIDPTLRPKYVVTMHHLLTEKGKLVGLLFDKEFDKQGPPFGGSKRQYEPLFSPYFTFNTFEACHNSVLLRQGAELFINFSKK